MTVKYVAFPTKRAYGVELELSSNGISKSEIASAIANVDSKSRSVNVMGWGYSDNNKDWHVKEDSSCGWEVASYKSRGVKDLLNIGNVTNAIKTVGGRVTYRCGFHLHVEVSDFSQSEVATLVAIWMKVENVIINMVPSHRANNKYCRLLNDYHEKVKSKEFTTPLKFWQAIKPNLSGHFNKQRRVALNIWNYAANDDRQTVEFRFPEGTLDARDVQNWIRLLVRLVDFSKKYPFPEDIKEVGLTETLRLIGLSGSSDFFLLSNGLRNTKEWFLYRIVKYSRNKKLCRDAVDELNRMWAPIKIYGLSPDHEVFYESI